MDEGEKLDRMYAQVITGTPIEQSSVVLTEEDRDLWREMERGVEDIIRRGGIPVSLALDFGREWR